MKRLCIVVLVLGFGLAEFAGAQNISVQRTTFVPNQGNVHNTHVASALNTKTGLTLVVWERISGASHGILGRLVNAQGKPASGQFMLAPGPNSAHPDVAYNPQRNEFLLVYDNSVSGRRVHTDVFAKRLNAKGRSAGAASAVTSDPVSSQMWNFEPQVLFHPGTSAFAVVWIREVASQAQVNDGNHGLVGAELTVAGKLGGAIGMIQRSTAEFDWPVPLDAQYDPSGRRLMVVFSLVATGTNGTRSNYFLASLNPDFSGIVPANIAKINSASIEIGPQFSQGAALALFPDSPGFVVYVDQRAMKRRKIDAAGKPAGGSAPAFKAPRNNTKLFYPAVAFSNTSPERGILVAVEKPFSETGQAVLWAQILNKAGAPQGPPAMLDTTSSTSTTQSCIINALPQTAGVSFSAFYTLAEFLPPGQTFQNSGIVHLLLNHLP